MRTPGCVRQGCHVNLEEVKSAPQGNAVTTSERGEVWTLSFTPRIFLGTNRQHSQQRIYFTVHSRWG
jgi:hypothetical protein